MGERVQIPPQLQEEIAKLQQLQQTFQVIVNQKQQVELEVTDTDKALEELDKTSNDTPVFQSIGEILVKKDKTSLSKELTERKELLNVRVTVLGKQEEKTKEKLKDLEQQLQAKLRTSARAPPL